jgi:hypothetical protein
MHPAIHIFSSLYIFILFYLSRSIPEKRSQAPARHPVGDFLFKDAYHAARLALMPNFYAMLNT